MAFYEELELKSSSLSCLILEEFHHVISRSIFSNKCAFEGMKECRLQSTKSTMKAFIYFTAGNTAFASIRLFIR